jgi:hypothetical protein
MVPETCMPSRVSIVLFLIGLLTEARATDGFAFFEGQVRPLLIRHCLECHSESSGQRKGGLWLDRREGWERGGDSGPAIIPGHADRSPLIRSVRYHDESLQMPPKNRLSQEEVDVLERWVTMGAPDPRDAAMAGAVRTTEIDYAAARRSWAFRPHRRPAPPAVKQADWPRNPVDRFLLARLEEHQLMPAADASPGMLLRRVHYDLTGLPPTPAETARFIADPSPRRYAEVVDQLLARPAYGEKWGRHWLDVARYADSNGGDRNFTFFQAWRYRNYVIESFNKDRPYHQFIRQQLAGDLLPATTDTQRHDQLVASTFLALGPKMLTERDKEKLRLDTADEQVDVIGQALLGQTLGCARCHDHKFDPFSQSDYYALAGIFRSTQVVLGTRNGCVNVASWIEQTLPVPEPERSATAAKVARMELAMRLTVEQQFQKKAGGKMTPDHLPLAGVIYDELDAELVGTWRESRLNQNRFGNGYVVYDPGTGSSRAIFRASLPENGEYEVRVAYSPGKNRAGSVPITVEAWDGIHQLTLDERRPPQIAGLFQPVGRFRFEKGGRANLIIDSAGVDGFLIVDAVQFIAVTDLEREARALKEARRGGGDPLFSMNEGELKKELGRLIRELRDAPVAMAPRDAEDAGDIHLRVRGVPGQLGELIPRSYPKALFQGPAPVIPPGQSGRLQFADWITGDGNALLDRVIVNRIWHHLFGRGIVASVDNFGILGIGPSHAGLLDHLASVFRSSGGSIKQLVRSLVLSRAYQLSGDAGRQLSERDPENRWFGRQHRRRLTAEEIRDSVLFISGRLDARTGGATSASFGEDLDQPMTFAKETLRTVYLPSARNNQVAALSLFDVANPDLVSGARATTTVPTQSLYLLNADFILNEARIIGAGSAGQSSDEQRIASLYHRILNRPPDYVETRRGSELLGDLTAGGMPIAEACGHLAHLLLISTEFLFLD